MIDTHCHLYDKKLYHKLDEIVDNAENANIKKMICIGDRLSTSEQSINISEQYKNIYASVGIHPHEAKDAPKEYLDHLKNKATHKAYSTMTQDILICLLLGINNLSELWTTSITSLR